MPVLWMMVDTFSRPSPSGSGSGSRGSSPALRWAPSFTIYGALPFIYGTLLTSVIAMLIAVPVAVLIALLITEILPARVRTHAVAVTVDLLAAIPSVVYGLWGLLVLSRSCARSSRPWPARSGRSCRSWPGRRPGPSYFAAGRHRRDHDRPDHRGPQPRGVRGHAPPAAGGGPGARRHALGRHPDRRPAASAGAASWPRSSSGSRERSARRSR